MKEIFKNVREKLVAKYLDTNNSKNTKKFKPRLKARIRKNKQILTKNLEVSNEVIHFHPCSKRT